MWLSDQKDSFGNVYLRTFYNQEQQYLHCLWYGYVSPEDIEQAGDFMLMNIAHFSLHHILSDHAALKGEWHDISGVWLTQHFIPEAIKAGLRKHAFIEAKDLLARQSLHTIINKYFQPTEQLQLKSFETAQEAIHWLKN